MIYAKCIKRILDFLLSIMALIIFSPLIVFLTVIGMILVKGNPFFTQERPGLNEKIFKLIKFRTMTNQKDANGEYLPDEIRDAVFYEPGTNGHEKEIRDWMEFIRRQ